MKKDFTNKLQEFENYLWEKELAPNTIKSYRQHLAHFAQRYNELTKPNLIEWKRGLAERLAPKSVNHYITMMNEYLKWLGKYDLCLRKIKVQTRSSVENVISFNEFNSLLTALKADGNMRWYYVVLFLAKTGVRINELIKLKYGDLKRGYGDIPTNGKIRRIYFCDSLRTAEIMEYFGKRNDEDYLIENRFGEQITARGVAQQLQNFAKKYGINPKVMHPHSFRHFFAIEFLKRDKDISLLADLLGHSSINTTAIYLRLNQQEQKERLNKAMNF